MLLGHGHGREHSCRILGLTFLPRPPCIAGFCLLFFFNCCKTDVAGTAVHMRNGQLMNSANHSNYISWMVSAVLDHSHSRTLIRQCCYRTLPPFLFTSSPPSTSITIPNQIHDGICVKIEESTWNSHSCSSGETHLTTLAEGPRR